MMIHAVYVFAFEIGPKKTLRILSRCFNVLSNHFNYYRGGMTKQEVQSAQAPSDGRVEMSEESIDPHMNEGTKFRNVTPKTYKILNEQLDSGSIARQAEASQAPASGNVVAKQVTVVCFNGD